MVNYIEPNLQEIIFGPIRVGLITQKQYWDHLKKCHSWGRTPYLTALPETVKVKVEEKGNLSNNSPQSIEALTTIIRLLTAIPRSRNSKMNKRRASSI